MGFPLPRAREWILEEIGRVSPKASAYLDWLNPSARAPWGGPFNGQRGRQEIVRQLWLALRFPAVVETGTYRGTTTEFLGYLTGGPVYTVESSRRSYEYAARRFRDNTAIHLVWGDSRAFLRELSFQIDTKERPVFFYLDAHWGGHVPLKEELEIIIDAWRNPVIMIDDFRVPDDPDYYYDRTATGRELGEEYLAGLNLDRFALLLPRIRAVDETGPRKTGCCVLVPDRLAVSLPYAVGLRPA